MDKIQEEYGTYLWCIDLYQGVEEKGGAIFIRADKIDLPVTGQLILWQKNDIISAAFAAGVWRAVRRVSDAEQEKDMGVGGSGDG